MSALGLRLADIWSLVPVAKDPRVLLAGDRVAFEGSKKLWDVRIRSERFVICTQQVPFEKAGTLQYTVLDLERCDRGPINLVGNGYGDGSYSLRECKRMLLELEWGELEVSRRNHVPIRIDRIRLKEYQER